MARKMAASRLRRATPLNCCWQYRFSTIPCMFHVKSQIARSSSSAGGGAGLPKRTHGTLWSAQSRVCTDPPGSFPAVRIRGVTTHVVTTHVVTTHAYARYKL